MFIPHFAMASNVFANFVIWTSLGRNKSSPFGANVLRSSLSAMTTDFAWDNDMKKDSETLKPSRARFSTGLTIDSHRSFPARQAVPAQLSTEDQFSTSKGPEQAFPLKINISPPPPRPLKDGLTTPRQSAAPTAASTAWPPLATIPWRAMTFCPLRARAIFGFDTKNSSKKKMAKLSPKGRDAKTEKI
ncbi:mitochondrial import inner membrane translocase [Striga asiatica]|uniref:Mitochondrial import inner membrane translocase n=1 Tax=Striga asiatica TaxID=4170 RepID=A0A5A7R1A7_STRAF|nr:mitochondrial import inner membrane translocase [Striga asiatica]